MVGQETVRLATLLIMLGARLDLAPSHSGRRRALSRAATLMLIGCGLWGTGAGCSDCSVRPVADATSPDGAYKATITAQSCGGATGGTAVTISLEQVQGARQASQQTEASVEVFAANRWVKPSIRWDGPDTLIVAYHDADAQKFGSSVLRIRREPWNGVQLIFQDAGP